MGYINNHLSRSRFWLIRGAYIYNIIQPRFHALNLTSNETPVGDFYHQYDLSVIKLAYVTKCILMTIEQVWMVRSAHLFEFVWMIAYYWGSGAAAPDSGVQGAAPLAGVVLTFH